MADATILRGRTRRSFGSGGGFVYEGVAAFPTTASTCTLPIHSASKVRNVFAAMLGQLTAPTLSDLQGRSLSASISATSDFMWRMPRAGTVTNVALDTSASVSASDSTYWKFKLLNKTAASTVVDDATAANSTQATGGSATTAFTSFPLTLGAGTTISANDLYQFTATKTSTPAALTGVAILVTYTYTGPQDEAIYLPSPNATSGFFDLTSGKITIGRNGTSLTSAGKFEFRVEYQ